jgi:hypothetical protein
MYTFADYKLRATTESDRAHCAAWIAADPDHAGKVKADFFLAQEPGIESLVLEDKFGEPIFYFRMTRAVRVDIQFGPSTTRQERERNQTALTLGLQWLEKLAILACIRQISFESTNPKLRTFCEYSFGFEGAPNELLRAVAPPPRQLAQEKPLQPLHHATQEGS